MEFRAKANYILTVFHGSKSLLNLEMKRKIFMELC